MRLHHVALGARDVERVAAFYRDALGLPETARHRDGGGALRSIWLDLGGALLMIERTGEPRRTVTGVGAGPFLLALRAAPAEIARIVERLRASGTPVESRTAHTVYFRDPEGNRAALSSFPDALRLQ